MSEKVCPESVLLCVAGLHTFFRVAQDFAEQFPFKSKGLAHLIPRKLTG